MAEAGPVRAPRSVLAAAALVTLEGAALLVFAVVSLVLAVLSDTGSVSLALGGALLLGFFGAVLFWLAGKLRELKPAARSPVVAVQIVGLPIGWTLTSTNGRPEIGLPVMAVAAGVLLLLFGTAGARDALARDL